jgi:hypothetical protein
MGAIVARGHVWAKVIHVDGRRALNIHMHAKRR